MQIKGFKIYTQCRQIANKGHFLCSDPYSDYSSTNPGIFLLKLNDFIVWIFNFHRGLVFCYSNSYAIFYCLLDA